MSFPLDRATCLLAPLDPVLIGLGFKLREVLPAEPLPFTEGVARLTIAMLGKYHQWDCRHGEEDGRGWVSVDFPNPRQSAIALQCAYQAALGEGTISAEIETQLRALAEAIGKAGQIMYRMHAAAGIFGLDCGTIAPMAEVYQVGAGARGLHFHYLSSDRDALTGRQLERDKLISAQYLHRFGLPATRGVLLDDAAKAARAIEQVGLPCVVKPTTMSRGFGVATGLRDVAQVAEAAAFALKLSGEPVLVENHVEGDDHRLMVVGDELLWVYRKVAARVAGDGTATVRQLVERENARRAEIRSGTEAYLYQIAIDPPFLRHLRERYELDVDDVLAPGRQIDLASQANIARGGYLEDVTGQVHPDNREMALRVARLFRIDSLGIDYLTPDISRSWKEIDTAIVEVNRTPGISGVGDTTLCMRTLFPNRLSGRIPTAVVIGDAAYGAAMAKALRTSFADQGLRTVAVKYRRSPNLVLTTAAPGVQEALFDPDAEALVIACDGRSVELGGLPVRACDLLLVQEPERLPWLAPVAPILAGDVSAAKIDHATARLKRLYADPAEGGRLPVLEPLPDDDGDRFRLTVWRARPMPRAWFWRQVGADAPSSAGLTTHDDLLGAVRALANRELARGGLNDPFAYGDLVGSWFRITFEAAIPLPAKHREAARAALLAATDRVNRIVAAKIA